MRHAFDLFRVLKRRGNEYALYAFAASVLYSGQALADIARDANFQTSVSVF